MFFRYSDIPKITEVIKPIIRAQWTLTNPVKETITKKVVVIEKTNKTSFINARFIFILVFDYIQRFTVWKVADYGWFPVKLHRCWSGLQSLIFALSLPLLIQNVVRSAFYLISILIYINSSLLLFEFYFSILLSRTVLNTKVKIDIRRNKPGIRRSQSAGSGKTNRHNKIQIIPITRVIMLVICNRFIIILY